MAGDRLTTAQVLERVDKCLELRYTSDRPILQKQWIAYCHDTYGDKSEQQYHAYWASAKEKYEEGWRAKLDGMLEPAMEVLLELLHSDNNQVRQRAIDQILKYSGNDIDKQAIDITIKDIDTQWG